MSTAALGRETRLAVEAQSPTGGGGGVRVRALIFPTAFCERPTNVQNRSRDREGPPRALAAAAGHEQPSSLPCRRCCPRRGRRPEPGERAQLGRHHLPTTRDLKAPLRAAAPSHTAGSCGRRRWCRARRRTLDPRVRELRRRGRRFCCVLGQSLGGLYTRTTACSPRQLGGIVRHFRADLPPSTDLLSEQRHGACTALPDLHLRALRWCESHLPAASVELFLLPRRKTAPASPPPRLRRCMHRSAAPS